MSGRKRVSKPTKKADSPLPESDFDESEEEVRETPPPAKKRKAPAKTKTSDTKHKETKDAEEAGPKKRKYTPKRGTSNHAFLVTLLEAQKDGEDSLTKAELMERADKSGISEKPIYGSEDSKSPAGFPIDGWTNFKTLKKHELVVAEGRPLRVNLTPEGTAVAEELAAAA